ncbi:hypothetical protein AYL99_11861 [Fonsecaea erecta]|uniref:CHAT domain-containing protein n=1 Tax=Fonsecaea erecta TaxID=1367422 RepID=A0A178Z378_9EURO|nr:hypothetical protein AYL99_11861 [Fonsecaea erecta]OAP53981.1 hypothetical protein AYL99_11861 [Fonsecaea erecta]
MGNLQAWLEDENVIEDFILNQFEAAMTLASDDAPLQAHVMSYYARLKIQQFWRNGRLDDLAEAIEKGSQVLTIIADPEYADRLDCPGLILGSRYERAGSVHDVEKAIQLSRQAVEGRFERTGRMEDLEEAIQVARKAVEVTPPDEPNQVAWLNSLGSKLQSRFVTPPDHPDLVATLNNLGNKLVLSQAPENEEALEHFLHAWNCANGIPFHRLAAAVKAIDLLKRRAQWTRATQVVTGVTRLLPLVNNRSLSRDDQRHVVAQFSGIASDVVALVLQNEGDAFHALELLEFARGSIIGLLMDDLLRHLAAVRELDQCIHNIRDQPGHQRFLLGPTQGELQERASDGPIIVVNISDIRTMEAWHGEGLTVFMPYETREGRGKKNTRYVQFLRWLWEKCVRQILQAVHHGVQPSSNCLPRIWWIGAISSYTPTIKALAHTRARQAILHQDRTVNPHMLMVSMPTTPGASPLSSVTQEISAIEAATGTTLSRELLEHPDARSVLERIAHCNIVHFAGHGTSDALDPFNSSLLLQHGPSDAATVDPLTVQQVSNANLGRASIAYLSACSTAENRAARMMDEVIHLASGFQVSGFGHVVAAMWPSVDEVCVDMAVGFYERLEGGLGGRDANRAVAEAVHEATMRVRSRFRKIPLR